MAKEFWSKMTEAYEDYGLASRIGLAKKLITTTLEGSGSMENFFNQIMTTAHKLNGIS